MNHFKITDYTTQDWIKQVIAMMAIMVMAQMLFQSLTEKDWPHAIGHLIGIMGWAVIYVRMMKKLRNKNPQD